MTDISYEYKYLYDLCYAVENDDKIEISNIIFRAFTDKSVSIKNIHNIIVFTFFIRDIRNGKGNRKLFYHLIIEMYKYVPHMISKLIDLIPVYGYWKDLWNLYFLIPSLRNDILRVVKTQYYSDIYYYIRDKKEYISLLAKWLPREKSKDYKMRYLAKDIMYNLYNGYIPSNIPTMYRKHSAILNRILQTTEINMCGSNWKNIDPFHVPKVCFYKNMYAFLNEKGKERGKKGDNEVRYAITDRIVCRSNFIDYFHVMNDDTPFYKIGNKAMSKYTSDIKQIFLNIEWHNIIKKIISYGGLNNCVAMCDFSASMNGFPRLLSIMLGILISDISNGGFKGNILTYDLEPKWYSFEKQKIIKNKIQNIPDNIGQGITVDYYKACMMILDKLIEGHVKLGEEPEYLVVLTDTEDEIIVNWDSLYSELHDKFYNSGGWSLPKIIIWNISRYSESYDIRESVNRGIYILSGWSIGVFNTIKKYGIYIPTFEEYIHKILYNTNYNIIRKHLKM